MDPVVLSVVYCVAVAIASLLGGSIPHWIRLTHTRLQLALSFVAGVILGVGLLHMIPHGFFALAKVNAATAIDQVMLWTLGGFLLMFFLERFFHFHHHEAPAEDAPHDVERCVHEHDCDEQDHAGHVHPHTHSHEHGSGGPKFAWGGALIGMTLHGLLDGVALAAAVKIDAEHGHGNAPLGMLFGVGTFIAVLLHKPFDALTIGTLMAAGGWSVNKRHVVNLLYALMTPLGVALFLLGASKFLALQDEWLGYVLCSAGGAFVCIATSDLLPELQFHSHDRFKLSVSLLLGVALAWGIVFLESVGHAAHDHGGPNPAQVENQKLSE